MMKRNNRREFAVSVALAVCMIGLTMSMIVGPASADSSQYYMVARVAPAGSITSGGQSQSVVYLRWDSLEGALPADVTRIRLVRDRDTVLLDEPVGAVMDLSQVAALYAGSAQQRRLVETLRNLKEQAVSEGRDFEVDAFAGAVRERIDPASGFHDPMWAFLASRNDINVARARYRAWVDDPGPGTFDYELLAVNSVGGTARLGFAQITTTMSQDVLSPTDFRQVLQAQCHLPELGLDHYTVALDWTSPGSDNPADRIASRIYVAGYDIYRTTENLDGAATSTPVRDIRAEAAVVGFDNRGHPKLSGLEKMNDTLLTIEGDDGLEATWEEDLDGLALSGGLLPEWLETQDQLKIAGLKPGDKRGYYLVTRDFTGNYGATLATVVVVPNKLRPPAPWELRDFADQTGRFTSPPETGLAMSWDSVNVDNYLDTYQGTRRFCNLTEARTTGVLEFVALGENCDEDVRRSVRLDVSTYRVYRFDAFDDAARFKDSDGDGVSDRHELSGGTQCDAGAQPGGAPKHGLAPAAIGLSELTLPVSGRKVIRFHDLDSQSAPGKVFWYRVASLTPDGRLSVLSAPQRGFFPDRVAPPKPIVSMLKPGREEDGGCELDVDRTAGPWGFSEELDGRPFSITCGSGESFLSVSEADVLHGGASLCETIATTCGTSEGGSATLTYPEKTSGNDPYTCSIRMPEDLDPADQGLAFCAEGVAHLVPSYRDTLVPVNTGDVTGEESMVLVDEPAPNTCVTLYENIDGAYTKVATSCNALGDPSGIEHLVASGFFCGYAVTQDENNNISASVATPCTVMLTTPPKPPATPQPVEFAVDDRRAELAWRLPIEPVAVTLVRLEHRPGDGSRNRKTNAVPAPGSGAGEVVRAGFDIPALIGDRDEWCVSYRALGINAEGGRAKASGWSSPRCVERRLDGQTVPEYLPWPEVADAPEGPPLPGGVLTFGPVGFLYVDIAPIKPVDQSTLFRNCLFDPQKSAWFLDTKCTEEGKLLSDAILEGAVHFVVYRQERKPHQAESDWVQVSPLIEFAHWDDYEPSDGEPKFLGRYLRDPYIKLRRNDPNDPQIRAFSFVDQYPYSPDREFRYQLVYFSRDHRIVRTRESAWIEINLFDGGANP